MEQPQIYRKYAEYLKEKYGEKVYKLPVNLPVTCPNRDGTVSCGGCTFCGDEGAGFENLSNTRSVEDQVKTNREFIRRKYNANKFIVYFQNFTNTYMPLAIFQAAIEDAVMEDVVEIAVSTRPDCIRQEYLAVLAEAAKRYDVEISIELGLQTVNYHTLQKINRGHTLAEFIDAVRMIQNYGFEICVHLILNLPWDTMDDTIENAKIISALRINQVKLHALYLVKDTKMGEQYTHHEFQMIEAEEYKNRVITFLEYLSPDIVIQRLIGRAPEENTLFVNWDTSWWKIRDEIERQMEKNRQFQGRHYNYLNGRAVKKFV